MNKKNIILLILLILLVATPLVFVPNAEYGGADGIAQDQIMLVSPNYEPWFNSFWEPPSGEIESLIFALQASVGTAFIAYVIGYMSGKKANA